jgi:hypothetical protein
MSLGDSVPYAQESIGSAQPATSALPFMNNETYTFSNQSDEQLFTDSLLADNWDAWELDANQDVTDEAIFADIPVENSPNNNNKVNEIPP